jgi:SAM-dependent methyltransferase
MYALLQPTTWSVDVSVDMGSEAKVSYTGLDELWQAYDQLVLDLAKREGASSVAELGGGANPIVGDAERWGFIQQRVVLDISADELAKAEGDVQTRVADLCQPIQGEEGSYDLVFSKMLCEHLPNARVFHENCFKLLRPGGLSVHFFPTLYTLPFVINRLVPEDLTRSLLRKVQPGRLEDPKHQKFPAYYRWCTGPTKRAIKRYESAGFEVEQWDAAFGHLYYQRIPLLNSLERAKTSFLLQHPVRPLTSFATVVMRKPA